jgi:hypothetical protein
MNNEARTSKYPFHTSGMAGDAYLIFHALCAFLLIFAAVSPSMAQMPSKGRLNPETQTAPERIDSTELKNTYIFAGIGAFIPTGQSYMQNYSTNFASQPVEINGGLLIPVTNDICVPLTVRYVRRVANFVNDGSIDVFSIEPGIRFYLERQRIGELRLFGGVSALLTRATVSGDYDVATVSPNGAVAVTGTALAEQPYLDVGTGIDLGLSYPLSRNSALDGTVHIALYLASPVSDGGLGDIGGVSLCVDYRVGF